MAYRTVPTWLATHWRPKKNPSPTDDWTNRYIQFYFPRKRWKKSTIAYETYFRRILIELNFGRHVVHVATDFWEFEQPPIGFPWDRKPWKRTNTWQTIMRLKIVPETGR